MKLIDRADHQKLYVQLYEIIKEKIENAEWAVGSRIPTEDDLCKMFNVSRITVRSAISELVKRDYLIRQQGKGTFVKKVIPEELIMLTSFRELMLEPGITFSTNVLAKTVMMPVCGLNTKLNISEDKHVIYIKRTTIVENKPAVIQEIYVPLHICPSLLEEDIENNSLFDLFKKHDLKITRVRNYFGIAYLNSEEGKLFDLPEGSPVLLLNQHFFSGETQIMYIRSSKRPDDFKFSIEFERSHMNGRRFYVRR